MGTRFIDMTGRVYGRLTVLRDLGPRPENVKKDHYWLCRCSCGNEVEVAGQNMRSGGTVSCGCAQKEAVRKRCTSHGMSRTPTFICWVNMIHRCRYKYDSWKLYHNVTVCSRWKKFENFVADMGERPGSQEVDRVDGKKGYWCGKAECSECGPLGRTLNCRWATDKEQANNLKTNLLLTFQGQTHTLREWAVITGLDPACIFGRLDVGFSDERTLTQRPRAGSAQFNSHWDAVVTAYEKKMQKDWRDGKGCLPFKDGERTLYIRSAKTKRGFVISDVEKGEGELHLHLSLPGLEQLISTYKGLDKVLRSNTERKEETIQHSRKTRKRSEIDAQ